MREAIAVYESLGATTCEVSLPHSRYGIATYYIIAPCEASSNLARYDGVHYGYRTDEQAMQHAWEQQRAQLAAAGQEQLLDSPLVQMYRRNRSEALGPEVKRRIMLGTYVLSAGYYDAYYRKAQKVRRLIQDDFFSAFRSVDCILMPTAPTTAFKQGEKIDDPLQMYLSDVYTVSANLAGIPAVSVPCGVDSQGLPVGVQILGKHFDESTVLRVADFLEQS